MNTDLRYETERYSFPPDCKGTNYSARIERVFSVLVSAKYRASLEEGNNKKVINVD